MTSIANTNQSTRPRRCSLCGLSGHNMSTCIRLRFHQNQTHRLYVYKWQKWLETMTTSLRNHQPRFFDNNPSNYLNYANLLLQENSQWLKNINNFRLLKGYLGLNIQHGTDEEIRKYIEGLYHYLVMKKYGLYDEVPGTLDSYSCYDYLLDTIPHNRFSNVRQYGITVEKKTLEEENLLKSCPICYDDVPFTSLVKTNCCHTFCQTCVINTIKILPINTNLSCAMCRTNINHLSCYTSESNTNLKKILNIHL